MIKRKVTGFTPDAMDIIRRYTWPGNVRELENAIERAKVLTKRPLMTPEDLPQQILDAVDNFGGGEKTAGGNGEGKGGEVLWDGSPLHSAARKGRRRRSCWRRLEGGRITGIGN